MANTAITLPLLVTQTPDYNHTIAGAEPERLHSVANSRVVLHSLKQSRERWFDLFPTFSSRSRGKYPGVVPPAHTAKRHGTCDIHVGPHVFPSTSIWEVNYAPPVNVHRLPQPQVSSWNPATQPPSQYSSPSNSEPSRNPLLAITPDLLARVHRASAANPTLLNLLQQAASGYATHDQLRTLGLLIQSLAASPDDPYSSPSPYAHLYPDMPRPTSFAHQSATTATNKTQLDLVFEFPEKPSVQFVFPRGPITYERVSSATHPTRRDILLTTCLPFELLDLGASSELPPNDQSFPSQVVTFRFENAPASLWDFIPMWAGGPSMLLASERVLENKRNHEPSRKFLQHRLPEGPLLTQLHNTSPPFQTKLVQPASSDPAVKRKRKPAQRNQPTDSDGNPIPKVPRRKAAVPPEQHDFIVSLGAPIKVSCQSCGQTDVPLLQGGRFCRTCVETSNADIQMHDPYRPQSSAIWAPT